MKWRWNTLTQRFLQVVRNTKKALYLGVKLQARQQKKRKLLRTEEKRPCAPFTLRFGRVVEAEVWLRVECRQGDSSAVWGQLQGVMCQALERVMEEEEHGRRKKAFHPRGVDLCAWVYGRSRTKTPKGRMFKVY